MYIHRDTLKTSKAELISTLFKLFKLKELSEVWKRYVCSYVCYIVAMYHCVCMHANCVRNLMYSCNCVAYVRDAVMHRYVAIHNVLMHVSILQIN